MCFLARDSNPCTLWPFSNVGCAKTLMSHSVAREKTARASPTRARAKEGRVEKVAKQKARVVARVP